MNSVIEGIIEAFNASLEAKEQSAFETMTDAWMTVEDSVIDQMELLIVDIQAMDTPTQAQIYQLDRLQSLLVQVQDEIETFVDAAAEPMSTALQREYIEDALRHADDVLTASLSEGGLSVGFDRLPVQAVQNLVGLSGDGSPLREALMRTYDAATDGILSRLTVNLAEGVNPRQTARTIVREGLSNGLSHTLTVARTESMRALRTASEQAYKASGLVEEWIRLETLDLTTCAGCIAVHGKIYPISLPFDAHPNCRGAPAPLIDGFDLDVESGEEFYNSLSEADKLKMMGPERVEYLKQGGDFSLLAIRKKDATWGASIQPTPIKDLEFKRTPKKKSKPKPKAKKAATAKYKPAAGPTVESALDQRPKRGKYSVKYQRALDAINKVHTDGDLPAIPIKTNNAKNAYGTYGYFPLTDEPDKISVAGSNGDHHELTLAHEIGHFIDHKGLEPSKRGQSSQAEDKDPLVDQLLSVAKESKALKRLDEMAKNPKSFERVVNWGGQDYTVTAERTMVRYLQEDVEVFARAYSQYVAVKSEDPIMLDQLRKMQNDGFYPVQWDDDDFEPISQAIDELFLDRGWIE